MIRGKMQSLEYSTIVDFRIPDHDRFVSIKRIISANMKGACYYDRRNYL